MSDVAPINQECRKCKILKPLTGFYNHPKMKWGKDSSCIPCRKKYSNSPYFYKLQKEYRKTPKGLFVELKKNAKKAGRELTITQTQFLEIRKLPCHYCNLPLPETAPCMDRKDSLIGYTFENCLPCCGTCNIMKSDLTIEEFFEKVKQIYNFHLKDKK